MPKLSWNLTGDYMPDGLQPAKQHIPDWYKDIKIVNLSNLKFDDKNQKITSVKNCVPFLESLSTGYLATLWCDIKVSYDNHGIPRLNWFGTPDPVLPRPQRDNVVAKPAGHVDINLGWASPYMLKAPKGYSAVIGHPFNRHDLPFTTLTGIVDLDTLLGPGVFPFYLHEDFEGVIPAGTPLFQVTPFKRENWTSERDPKLLDEWAEQKVVKDRTLLNWYRHNVWHKKDYS